MSDPGDMARGSGRAAGPDALRILAFVGVVTLHVHWIAERDGIVAAFGGRTALGFMLDELSRVAVPCFFILTGYFWRDDGVSPLATMGRALRRVGPAFLLWIAIYAAAAAMGWPGAVAGLGAPQFGWLLSGGPAVHLWFLPALVIGTGIARALLAISLRAAIGASLALFVLGTLLGAYSPLIFHGVFETTLFRNGVFFAPVFLVAGVLLRRGWLARLDARWLVAAAITFGVAHVAEGFVTGRFPLGHDYSLATLGYAVATAALFIRWRASNRVVSTLGEAVFTGYLVHLMVLELLASTGLAEVPFALIPSTVVFSFGIALSIKAMLRYARPVLYRRQGPIDAAAARRATLTYET
jgi:surface polysaccharide O-acyltransferase-like enzyme